MRQSSKLLLLVMFLCLPLACEPSGNNPHLNFAQILPEDWQHVRTCRLDANRDGDLEWVVLYRFDLPAETEQRNGPIAAVVYQPDDRRPPCIIPYELRPQGGAYLCECKCTPVMEDVLSGLQGDELVVRDNCDEETTRLAIFYWNSDEEQYLPTGHFSGSRITVASDEVTVERHQPEGRAQLALRCVYRPYEDNKTYYLPGDEGLLVPWEKYEFVFYQGEPADVMLSPYPEKIVLAFYNHYTDTVKVPQYFTKEGWERLEQCAVGRCGCTSARSEIEHVRVTELLPKGETYSEEPPHPWEDRGPDRATVHATVICERRDGVLDAETSIQWYLIREDDRWKLNEVKPAED